MDLKLVALLSLALACIAKAASPGELQGHLHHHGSGGGGGGGVSGGGSGQSLIYKDDHGDYVKSLHHGGQQSHGLIGGGIGGGSGGPLIGGGPLVQPVVPAQDQHYGGGGVIQDQGGIIGGGGGGIGIGVGPQDGGSVVTNFVPTGSHFPFFGTKSGEVPLYARAAGSSFPTQYGGRGLPYYAVYPYVYPPYVYPPYVQSSSATGGALSSITPYTSGAYPYYYYGIIPLSGHYPSVVSSDSQTPNKQQ